jgi:hypothetical protein
MIQNKTIILTMTIYSLILLTFIVALPLNQNRYTHTWFSTKTENRLYIPLVDRVPERVTINVPCEIFQDDNYEWLVEFKGGTAFQLFKDSKIGVVVGNTSRTNTKVYFFNKTLPNGANCLIKVQYFKSSHSLHIYQGGFEQSFKVDTDYRVEIPNNIVVNNKFSNQGISVIVETAPPSDVSETSVRKFILINFVILLLFTIFVTIRTINLRRLAKNLYSLIVESYFTLTATTLLALNFILPPRIDDGWRMTESWLLRETGIYNNYIVPTPLPTGRLLAAINGIFLNTNSFFIIRLPSVFALLIIWLASLLTIKKLFKRRINVISIRRYITFLIILFASAFLIGLRAEVYIATLLSLSLLVIVYENELSKISTFQLLLTFSGFALAIHQSGVSIASVCLVYAIKNFKEITRISFFKNPLLIISFCTIGLAIFYKNNLFSIYRSIKLYSSKFDEVKVFGDVATLNPLMEIKRFMNVFSYEQGLFTFSSLLLMISVLFLVYLYLSRIITKSEKYFILLVLCSFVAIFLTPSKWAWYYMSYLPLVIVSVFFLINYFLKLNIRLVLIVIPLILLISILNQSLEYGFVPIINFEMTYFTVFFKTLFLVCAVLLLLILFLLSFNYLWKRSSTFSNINLFKASNWIVLSSFSVLLSYIIAPIILDSRDDSNWSFIKQNLSLNSSSACGLFSDFGVQSQVVIDNLDNYAFVPCFKPLLFNHGVWEYPEFIVQSINSLDQQRLSHEIRIETSTCVKDYSFRYDEICLYKTSENMNDTSSKSTSFVRQY